MGAIGMVPVPARTDESLTTPESHCRDDAKLEDGGKTVTAKQHVPLSPTKASTKIQTSTVASGSSPEEHILTSKGTEEQKKPVKISFSGGKRLGAGGSAAASAKVVSQVK